jgi:hypothetical protein
MAKRKFTRMITPNTLETMIEYTLISNILDRICKMTTKPLECPRDPARLNPLKNLLKIRTWGTKWRRQIDKTIEWVAWQWVNVKINKESLALNCKHSKGGYGRLPLGDVYTHHGFLSRMRKFEKANSRTFLHKFIVRFINGGFGFPWQPPITKIYETW